MRYERFSVYLFFYSCLKNNYIHLQLKHLLLTKI